MTDLRFSFGWFKMADVVICSTAMPPAKRKRVTVTASVQGIDRAEKELIRLGFDSKSSFAKAQLMGKSAVDRFFNRQPIQPDSFKRICEGLRIADWRSVAELEPLVAQCGLAHPENVAEVDVVTEAIVSQPMNMSFLATRQITVTARENGKVQFEIVLNGDIASIDVQVQKTLETILRSWSGNTITITEIQPGSIRIKIQGSPQDAARLIDRLTSGEVKEINSLPVEDIQILSQDFLAEAEDTEENSSNDKWNLVREIITHPASQRQLRHVDLSDTDLSGADLSGTDLSGADLSGTDLSGADLSGTDLSGADLSGADLSGADLSGNLVSLARARDLARARTIALDRAIALDRTITIDRDFTRILAILTAIPIALALASVLPIAIAIAIAIASALALDRSAIAIATDRSARGCAIARARTIALDRARNLQLNLDRAIAIAIARAHDRELNHILDRTRELNHTLGLDHNLDYELNHTLDRAIARARTIALDRARQRVNLSGAIVQKARFGKGIGFTEDEKLDLKKRGAIFNDSTGDREFSLNY